MGAILAINLHHYQGRLILPGREITWQRAGGNRRERAPDWRRYPSRSRHASTTVCSMCLSFVRSRQRHCSPRARIATASTDGEYISYWQTPWLEVHPEEAIPVNLDGEPYVFRRSDMKPYQRRFS
jgi:Sphingosine kinase and enzymes related to eukaryotic diacylglycerol kinase